MGARAPAALEEELDEPPFEPGMMLPFFCRMEGDEGGENDAAVGAAGVSAVSIRSQLAPRVRNHSGSCSELFTKYCFLARISSVRYVSEFHRCLPPLPMLFFCADLVT